jgi:exosortase A
MTVLPAAQHAEPSAPAAPIASWRTSLVLIGVAIVVFGVGFHREATSAVETWSGTTAYNYCFLILPIVGYLLWERRSLIAASSPQPALWPVFLMPLFSAAWFLAAALDINEGRQLLVVTMFEIVLLSALGLRVYRLLLAPLLFLFFLVPTGEFLIPRLQSVTADISVAGLKLLHIPVFSDGYLIDIPEGRFIVAEACAGLRFLIATLVFSCLFAVVMYRSQMRRAFYIGLSIPVAIAANALRVFGTILLAHVVGNAAAVEADHIIYGWVFFSFVMALLIGIGVLLLEKDRRPASVTPPLAGGARPRWFTLVVPFSALLALIGPVYAAWLNSLVPNYSLTALQSPEVRAPWQALAGPLPDWNPVVRGADREFLESFDDSRSTIVTRYVALYRLRATGSQLTRANNRLAGEPEWHIAHQGRATLDLAGKTVSATRSEIVRGANHGLVWSFYVVNGRIAAGLLEAKLLQLLAVVQQQWSIAAFVIVETDVNAGGDGRIKYAEGALSKFLAASRPFPEYISRLR